jgi:hypothetical protein
VRSPLIRIAAVTHVLGDTITPAGLVSVSGQAGRCLAILR